MKKLGLALGSGGSRGVAHIGFLKALDEAGIQPDYICGCSMGAVVGAAYAAGMTPDEIWAVLGSIRARHILSFKRRRGGMFGTKKIHKLLLKYLAEKEFSDLKIPFHCVATDMLSQKLIIFSKGKVAEAVVASSCVPFLFSPMEIGGMRLVDGGVLERVPVPHTKEMGADIVVAVDVLGWRTCSEKKPNAFGSLMQTLDVMDNARTKKSREENANIVDFWLEPDLGDMSQSDFKNTERAYERGYALGVAYAPKIKEALEK